VTATSVFWRSSDPLILASGSPTRRALLEAAGIPVEVVRPQVDERAVEASLLAGSSGSPAEIASALAEAKALSIAPQRPGRLVLAADQVLSCDGALFHKPADAAAARRQIAALAGRRHHLSSAFVLARGSEVIGHGLEQAALTMRRLDADAIGRYVAAAGAAASASVGGYQLEGLGIHLFERIEGDHFTILGLPMLSLLALLRQHDLIP